MLITRKFTLSGKFRVKIGPKQVLVKQVILKILLGLASNDLLLPGKVWKVYLTIYGANFGECGTK